MAVVAAGAAAAFASQASAADLGGRYEPEPAFVPTVAPEPFWNWTGLYLGGNIGYGFSGIDGDLLRQTAPASSNIGALKGFDTDGVIGGLQAGYNWQREHMVLGLETDFQFTDMSDSARGVYVPSAAYSGAAKADLDWYGTVRARLGYAQGQALYYVTGGLAYGAVDLSQYVSGPAGDVRFSDDKTKVGYTVGAGIEYAFDPHWSTRLEYQYVDLGDARLNGGVGGEAYTSKYDLDFHTVRVGLNYKF